MGSLRVFVLVLVALHLIAPGSGVSSKEGKASDTGVVDIHMNADRLSYNDKKHILRMIGKVRITHEDSVITCAFAEFHTDTQKALLSGGVKIWQPGTSISGDRMRALFRERKAILEGKVKMITERGPKVEGGTSGTTTITCNQVEFFWMKREAIATGNVEVWQKRVRAYSDRAHYLQDAGLITLSGNVQIMRAKGEWMACPEAYINLREDTFVARGGVEGNFVMKKKEEKEKKKLSQEDRIIFPDLPVTEQIRFCDEIPEELRKESKP